MLFFLHNRCFMLIIIFIIIINATVNCQRENAEFWNNYGQTRLKETLEIQYQKQPAKNIILFIGDGMGMTSITAGRIYKGQHQPLRQSGEEFILSWEHFPFVSLSKTYNVDKQVPDSAATATAIFTGVKTNFQTIGFDAQAKLNICNIEVNRKAHLNSILLWAQKAGKDTGLVTTTRITHATPAATYAHINNRDWECDESIPIEYRNCIDDIGKQLVRQEPGKSLKVILGGGQKQMGVYHGNQSIDESCTRNDHLNLVGEWMDNKTNAIYVTNKEQLMDVDITSISHLIGLFSPGHMPYAYERTHQQPSLVNMTIQAIRLLSRDPNGFVLVVEGGRIDHAHHDNWAQLALEEISELDDAVAAALRYTNINETLVIVTADHSHAMTINGYPTRGNDILGLANDNPQQLETLSYANGPGYNDHWDHDHFRNLSSMNRTNPKYRHFTPIPLDLETHGGEDVPVYAIGPWAHLFTGVFEQNYIAHVIAYASCIGDGLTICLQQQQQQQHSEYNNNSSKAPTVIITNTRSMIFSLSLLLFLYLQFINYIHL